MTTIAQVRGSGPIFTTTAAVATDAPVYRWDALNEDPDEGVYYAEYAPNNFTVTGQTHIFFNISNSSSQGVFQHSLANNVTSGGSIRHGLSAPKAVGSLSQYYDIDVTDFKSGLSYSDSNSLCYLNGSPTVNPTTPDPIQNSEVAFVAFSASNGLRYPHSLYPYASRLRELRRYEVDTYADGKTLVDELVTAPASEGVEFTDGEDVTFVDGEYVKFET